MKRFFKLISLILCFNMTVTPLLAEGEPTSTEEPVETVEAEEEGKEETPIETVDPTEEPVETPSPTEVPIEPTAAPTETPVSTDEPIETEAPEDNKEEHSLVEKYYIADNGDVVNYWKCSICGETFSDENGENPFEVNIPEYTDNGAEGSGDIYANITYQTHVQDYGWQSNVSNGATSGTTGKSKRLEGIKISVSGNITGGIEYRTHVQNIGWQGWVSNGQLSGTTGRSLRLEGIQIRLTGNLANEYVVYYRTHVQDYGWQGWVSNGATSGTTGQSKRLEGIQIKLVKKSDIPLSVSYKVHVQDVGWQGWVSDGQMSGTSGRSKRLEGINITVSGGTVSGGIQYRTHVQDIGWQGWVSNGALSGTTGKSKRLEAIQIQLTGNLSTVYDVYYRVHVQDIGWQGWVSNGAIAGTSGKSKRLEAIEIKLVKKSGSSTQYVPTYYSQRDSRWANSYYGTSNRNMTSSGCVPTAVAMAVDGILHNGVNPATAAEYLATTGEFNNGEYHGGSGLAIKYGAEHWNLKTSAFKTYDSLVSCLNKGYIVLIQVGEGTFTIRGFTHCIVLFGYNGGYTSVYDPYNSKSGLYSVSDIWNQRSNSDYDWRGGYIGYGIYK